MPLPPGPVYLLKALPWLSVPPAVTALVLAALRRADTLHTPTWAITTGCLLSWPVILVFKLAWRERKIRREAAAAGAVLPPQRQTKLPGGLDRIFTMMTRVSNEEYPAYAIYKTGELLQANCYRFLLLFVNPIVTFEPEHVKIILATDFPNYPKGWRWASSSKAVLGNGVFASDGDLWKFHRGMTRPYFTRERIGHFDSFDTHAMDALSQMRDRLRQGQAVDFQDLVSRFTLDTATSFLFGHDVRSLSAGLPYPHEGPRTASLHPANAFAQAFAAALLVIQTRSPLGDAWPLREFWADRAEPHMRVIRAFIDPIVADALRRRREKGDAGAVDEENDTLLDTLIEGTDDIATIRDEILNIMIAGRDTTAATLTFMVYMLSEHPHVMHRLREEIIAHVGPNGRPSPEDLREMKYLRAVINETLRLYPIVPMNLRTNIQPAVWPSTTGGPPIYIPADTRCVYSVFVMHRREDLWGPDALEFDPDRFIDDRVQKYLTHNPFIFLPFNAGPRICLGQQFAYNEMSFMVVRLLQAFSSITLAPDAQPADSRPPAEWREGKAECRREREKVTPTRHLTMFVKGGLWIRAKEADAGTGDGI